MKKDEKVIYRCSRAVDDDALDELIRDLTETALASGGFVTYYGPDGDAARPPAVVIR